MNDLILSQIPVAELINQIRAVVKEEIKAEHQKTEGEKLLSPAETCKLFQPTISRVTLQSWTAAGHLKRHDIGGRVFYRLSEVIEAAKSLKRYKTK